MNLFLQTNHALIRSTLDYPVREVAYLETPETERTGLHRRAAEILEQNAPEAFERLALHFERAQVWEKAIKYSARAAEHAKEKSEKNANAADHWVTSWDGRAS